MNKVCLIGNLTRDPELRQTQSGIAVCSFCLAVNKPKKSGAEEAEADYFRVTAWRQLGESCAKYLAKGRKCCAVGPVELQSYTGQDGETRYSLCVTAESVEFLSSQTEAR